MVKLQFKQKCRRCKQVWVLVKARESILCDNCKKAWKR